MNSAKPTKPSRGNAKRPRPNPVEKAEHLQPIVEEAPVKELSMRDRRYLRNQSDKYLKQPKVGAPTLGRETGYVTEVGLGNLETQTAYDNSDLSA
jgi:hypothetical protein